MRPTPKLKHIPLHLLRLPLAPLQPPLRPEHIRIFPEYLPIAVQHPSIQRHSRPFGKPLAVDFRTFRWHEACYVESYGGTDAHGFFEAGLEEGQGLDFGPLGKGGEGA